MKISQRKFNNLIQSVLSNYLGNGIEPGFMENLCRNISYIVDHGEYTLTSEGFYGKIPDDCRLVIKVDVNSIQYKRENIGYNRNILESNETAKLITLDNGDTFVEYISKEVNINRNHLDDKKNDLFDSYSQKSTKRAFILDDNNSLAINYVETMKYNYNKNILDDQIVIGTPSKNKNYSEKIYYYLDGDRSIRHVCMNYLYPDEVLDYAALHNRDEFIIVDAANDVSFDPTIDEIAIYSKLEEKLNNIMYNTKNKVKEKSK